jgi:hypothetical protein
VDQPTRLSLASAGAAAIKPGLSNEVQLPYLIEPRFRPGMHTRVSAVCLFSSGVRASEHSDAWYWDVRTKLILNPHARFPLPQSIVEQLERFPSEEKDI